MACAPEWFRCAVRIQKCIQKLGDIVKTPEAFTDILDVLAEALKHEERILSSTP